MDQMKVVDIFKSQTGGYKWGQRDCMSTLCLLYQNLCTKIDPLNIEIFERLRQESEKKAWAYCIKNGGPQVFYFLRAGNGAKKVKNHSLTNPGDVLFYDKPIEVGIGAWIKGKPAPRLWVLSMPDFSICTGPNPACGKFRIQALAQ